MNVKYIGPATDYSGYGEANRHDIAALVASDVNVTTKLPKYCMEISNFGELGRIATSREGRDIPYDIVILHTTPNVYPIHLDPGKYHIGRVFWETDKLPSDFADGLKHVDEIWTGSEFNAQAIRNAGITDKPIIIIPEAIDTANDPQSYAPFTIVNQDTYRFYSIFEWTERKNPMALLAAYWLEFQNTPGVSLTIKSYIDNFTPSKRTELHDLIQTVKMRLGLSNYAPLYVFDGLMERQQIYRFHRSFNCYASAHRGEGWGIPQMEAMLTGNPVISTNLGGIHEYMTQGVHGFLLPYTMVPLTRNTRNNQWYTMDQHWADVNVDSLRQAMRTVFDNRDAAQKMGVAGRELVMSRFALKAVGDMMKERLTTITNSILKK